MPTPLTPRLDSRTDPPVAAPSHSHDRRRDTDKTTAACHPRSRLQLEHLTLLCHRGDSVDGQSAFVWPMWGSWHMGAQGADDGDEVGGARQSGRTVDVVESVCGFGGGQPERGGVPPSR